ncbi:MAG: phage portal protein [Phycisphaerae bacterium]|nr:phage portal protein [Phycisphaerae bacterium]
MQNAEGNAEHLKRWLAQPLGLFTSVASSLRRYVASWSDLRNVWMVNGWTGKGSVGEPMAKIAWVFAAIGAITRTCSGLEVRLLSAAGDASDEITNGPAADLLRKPWPGQTTADLVEQIVGYLVESGEAHLIRCDAALQPTSVPSQVRYLCVTGKRQMEPYRAVNSGRLLWWTYTPIGGTPIKLFPAEVATLRLFNPYDPIRGLSPAEAAAMDIRQDYGASEFNASTLVNGGKPGGIYSIPGNISEEDKREFERHIQDRHVGSANAGKPLILHGGWSYTATNATNADLSLFEGRRFNREAIFAVFGVPPVLGNVFDSAHYNVADAAQQIFLLNTIKPLTMKLQALLTAILEEMQPGVKVVIDITKHHVMQKIEQSKIDLLVKMATMGTPYNEAKDWLGLSLADQPWGKRGLLPTTLTPAEDVFAPPIGEQAVQEEAPPPAPAAKESEGDDSQDEAGLELQAASRRLVAFDASLVKRLSPPIGRRVASLLLAQEEQMIRRLRAAMKANGEWRIANSELKTHTAASEEEAREIVRRVLLSLPEQLRKWRALAQDALPPAIEAAIRAELQRLSYTPEQITEIMGRIRKGKTIEAIVRLKSNRISQVEAVTRTRVAATLTEGVKAGETTQQLADRIRDTMGGTRARALRIARTETGQAVSAGRFLGMQASGVKGKGWIEGANPRPTHVAAGRKYPPRTGAIAIDQPFVVGQARLMYPRDPNGPAGEIINCNCTLVPARLAKAKDE